jgi:hypothetical protein
MDADIAAAQLRTCPAMSGVTLVTGGAVA